MTALATPTDRANPADAPKGGGVVAVRTVGTDRHAAETATRLCALASKSLRYRLVDDPDGADLVLFVTRPDGDFNLTATRSDPVYRRLRGKCVVYSEQADAAAVCPGVYTGQPNGRWLAPGWAVPGPYVGKMRPSELSGDGVDEPIEHLYSFVGHAGTHPLRKNILALRDERALLEDTSSFGLRAGDDAARRRAFDLALARSAFVLCPRGRVPASIRFFEALRAGRAPVILADDWVLPPGPDWDAFVLRAPEAEVERLPARLRDHENEAGERGRLARLAWEEWFADDVLFDRLIDLARSVQRARRDTPLGRLWRRRVLVSPQHLRNTLRGWRRALRPGGRP